MNTVKVKFLKDNEPYHEGDVVMVNEDVVQNLVDTGVAEEADHDEALFVKGVTPEGAASPEAVQERDLKRTAAGSGREAFMSGPSNEPVKGTETEPEKTARKAASKRK